MRLDIRLCREMNLARGEEIERLVAKEDCVERYPYQSRWCEFDYCRNAFAVATSSEEHMQRGTRPTEEYQP
jgi:hypothetical protein